MEHKSPFRKRVKLSNGDEATVKKLNAMDFTSSEHIPVLTENSKVKVAVPGTGEDGHEVSQADAKTFLQNVGEMFMKGCIFYHHDGIDFKVVEKEPRDCAEDELSVLEIDPVIFAEIYNHIVEGGSVPEGTEQFHPEPNQGADSV